MAIPKQQEFEAPILEELKKARGVLTPQQVYAAMAQRFPGITQEEWAEKLRAGSPRVANLIQFARQRLVEKGEVDKSTRGVWKITPKGLARIGGQSSQVAPPAPVPVSTKSRHEELVRKIEEIRAALGYSEGITQGSPKRHDAYFAKSQVRTPFSVWEVCDSGNLDKDVTSLQWAANNWEAVGILVVADPKDVGKAKAVLPPRVDIKVITADFIDKLHDAIAIPGGADILKGMFQ